MISFIIPAYKAERTIEHTINSILNQTKTNIEYEIIVINDGSPDNLDDKMKKYENNEKVKYFKKENTGVADTRNIGVSKAKGEYIIFVDSDDYISQSLLEDIEPYIYQKIDLIKWNPIFVDENQNELQRPNKITFPKVSGEQGFNLLFGKDNYLDCLWNFCIKKEIMLEFPKGTYHEDFATMPLIILNAKTMVSIEKYEYYYVQSQNSIMRNNDSQKLKKKLQDKLDHYDNLIKKSKEMNLEKYTKENLSIFATNSLLVTIKDLDETTKKYFEEELRKRKISKNIKIRNVKQLLKKIYLSIKF